MLRRSLLLALLLSACNRSATHDAPVPPQVTPPKAGPSQAAGDAALAYPQTRREDIVETLHGQAVADPYRWLEDAAAPEVQDWMTAQDTFARDYLLGLPHREALEARLIELTYIDSVSPPSHRGSRYFYARTHADKEKAVYYYKEGRDGPEQVLLDPNALSEDGSIAVHGTAPSYDGRWVVYKLSENNADAATLHLRNIDTGEDSAVDTIEGAKYAWPSWTPDNKGFYYVRLPTDASIPPAELPGHAEVRYHRLGTDPAGDELVHPAIGDPTKFIGAGVSRDGHWLLLYKTQGPNNEVLFKDLRSRRGRKKGFVPLAEGFTARYGVAIHKDRFYVTTNEGAPNRRVFKVDPTRPQRDRWREIVPQTDDVLQSAYVVGGHLITVSMVNAYTRLQVNDLEGTLVREIKLPGVGSASGLLGRPDEDEAYFYYTSFAQPPMIYETSVATGDTRLWGTVDYPIDTSQIEDHQVWYESKDGTRVSMFVVHKKGLELDGSHPTLLTGYGGFNSSQTPRFSPSAAMWIERGGIWALPNLRGGGEYGEAWHEAGMLDRKQNVFDDFIAAAEYLVDKGYTRPEKLAIRGGSNGGLLVGAAMVQRPELFGAIVCAVPLLDMIRYHKFGSGKTWIPEYGDPEQAEHFGFLYAYSPYHHIEPRADYPALLMMSADSDDRVDPMHARKFTAAVQAASGSAHPAIMRIEQKAGHGGSGTRKQAVASLVDTYAFLLHELGEG